MKTRGKWTWRTRTVLAELVFIALVLLGIVGIVLRAGPKPRSGIQPTAQRSPLSRPRLQPSPPRLAGKSVIKRVGIEEPSRSDKAAASSPASPPTVAVTASSPGQPVPPSLSRKVAESFLEKEKMRVAALAATSTGGATVDSLQEFSIGVTVAIKQDDGRCLAYVHNLQPAGYIVTSADTAIRPVIAFSFKNNFDFVESKSNVLLHLVRADMKARLRLAKTPASGKNDAVVESNITQWKEY